LKAATFDPQHQGVLLDLTRGALDHAVRNREVLGFESDPDHPWLDDPMATFVTLRSHGELRGCVGSIEAHRSLGSDLCSNAYNAAFEDPRFQPLRLEEFPDILISVSLLSPLKPISFADEADLLHQLRPQQDGLLIEAGYHRGVFLPVVWEQLPDRRTFLEQLKRKAGLPSDFWSPDIQIKRFQALEIEEI